ncbi:MAG: hypothetical protein AAF633_21240 [Chloroflexota bacterium]
MDNFMNYSVAEHKLNELRREAELDRLIRSVRKPFWNRFSIISWWSGRNNPPRKGGLNVAPSS